jgi:signal transduction histidine kinase
MRRLLVWYGLAMTSVVLLAFLVPLGFFARTLAVDRALDAARDDAQSVAAIAGAATGDRTLLDAEVVRVNDGPMRTTVFLPDGSVVGEPAERTDAIELAASGLAFTLTTDRGSEVLVPVASGSETATVVRTFVPDDELTQGVTRAWTVLGAVGAALLAGTALLGYRLAGRLSRSVLELSDVAERLGAGDLTARVEPSGPPEVASVGRVLNGLGARVSRLLAAERELVADLSHRLRTPITALRLDVELLEDPRERARLTGHVDELVHAVDTIVRTARDPEGAAPHAACDAAQVVRDRARFWEVLAADQRRALRTDVLDGQAPVRLDQADLGAALDVLIDNVFSHTPAGTGFGLAVHVSGDGPGAVVRIEVADDGPGFAPELAERGRSGAGSTGIGLDVARRAAEDAGGRLIVGDPSAGGGRVVLEVPRA